MMQLIYLHHTRGISSPEVSGWLDRPESIREGDRLVLLNNWGISSPEASGWLERPESIRGGRPDSIGIISTKAATLVL